MNGMLVKAHISDCGAVRMVDEGLWEEPWAYGEYKSLPREKTARPHKGCMVWFLVYRCNNPECEAQLIFLADVVERILHIRPPASKQLDIRLNEFWSEDREVGWELSRPRG